ncbi:hypothetical protein PsYK624_097640 [Phanerochaete sordida]|uniref:Amine oxidase domain-containing protein n=1 Tax=Phanerochaete sordida TaxID=48140 RepID=A0A9P3GHB1_9APHY|nr:hypothetical protein PsYK624_097640 [Phanerochaete sordida]
MEARVFDTIPSDPCDPLDHYAQNIISEYHRSQNPMPPGGGMIGWPSSAHLAPEEPRGLRQPSIPIRPDSSRKRVAIIGGGIGGLYAALLLQRRGIPYTIFESSGRVGGRLHTYKFPGGGRYDYMDLGAMRFPDTPVMQPVFELFKLLGLGLLEYYFDDREGNSTSSTSRRTRCARSRMALRPSSGSASTQHGGRTTSS